MNTVIISFKTVCHITSTVRGFSQSLSLSVWQLYVAYGKQHLIISRRLKRLPEEDCEIQLELCHLHQKVRYMLCEMEKQNKQEKKTIFFFFEWVGHSPATRTIYIKLNHGKFCL